VDFTNGGLYEKHPWGLCHMNGNVYQWCSNLYEKTDKRVARGGSWFTVAGCCRSADRRGFEPDEHIDLYGFRVCLSLEEMKE
jgi:formylglycine-generating enzyme required for sulfatase activity